VSGHPVFELRNLREAALEPLVSLELLMAPISGAFNANPP
jgi:hypothetical protein